MELLAPVHGVGDEEVAHLVAPVVELQRAPVGVRGPLRVGVFVEVGAVEPGQRPVVAREVRGHPVHEDADAGPVERVDEVLEVVGGAEPGGGCVEAGDLVAPGAAEGVLRHRHQLDVREAEIGHVRGKLLGELTVRQVGAPGGEVDLVDGERGLVDRAFAAPGHPLAVAPLVVRGGDDRGGGGGHLRAPGHRVGAQGVAAVGPGEVELVERALPQARHEQLPHPAVAERAHGQRGAVPVAELPAHPDPARVRRPHREAGALDALVDHRLGAQRVPQPLVPALVDQVQVELAERGQEAVRVVRLVHRLPVGDPQPVAGDPRAGQERGEEAVAVVVQRGLPLPRQHRDRRGVRAQYAHGDAAGRRVGAQDGVRIVVRAGQQPLPVLRSRRSGLGGWGRAGSCACGHGVGLLDPAGGHSARRVIAAIGTGSQSGRCRAS